MAGPSAAFARVLFVAVCVAAVHGLSFPYARCNTNNFDTPYFIESLKLVSSAESSTNDYLLTLGANGCLDKSPCCSMDVNKISFHVYDKCKDSVAAIYALTNNGLAGMSTEGRSGVFQSFGTDAMIWKVTRLGWTSATAYGSQIKISLKKDSACPDKSTFFVDDNVYSIFNTDKTCCPVWDFAALVNPSGTVFSDV